MLYAGLYEDATKEHKDRINMIQCDNPHELKKTIEDTVTVLKQFGYEKGAEILKSIFEEKLI